MGVQYFIAAKDNLDIIFVHKFLVEILNGASFKDVGFRSLHERNQ